MTIMVSGGGKPTLEGSIGLGATNKRSLGPTTSSVHQLSRDMTRNLRNTSDGYRKIYYKCNNRLLSLNK